MKIELWHEIRRRRDEGVAIKAIARDLGVARNTVRRALSTDGPPGRRPRPPRASIVDPFEPLIVAELAANPHQSVAEIAQRVGWTRSTTVLKDRIRAIRPIAARDSGAADLAPRGLPVELTTFVGRDDEVTAVQNAVRGGRLVTLSGVGGVGKTRLAVRAVAGLADSFLDGVHMVELAALREGRLLAQTVVDGIGLSDLGESTDPLLALRNHLRDQDLLVILDNCEHLREEVAAIAATLLRDVPRLRVLATSRQPLGIPGEHVVVVPPLPVPESPDADAVAEPSVALFKDRAEAVVPGFVTTESNRADVVALCQQLDGIPLAIELAAARLRVLSVRDLRVRLEGRLCWLADQGRTTEERHRTLEATLGWSYDLCSDAERLLWARSAVFVGSFDLESVTSVCADHPLDESTVLDLVAALVDKSVLLREEDDGQVRFRMLETLRQFGLSRLSSDELVELRLRHCQWYACLADKFASEWFGPDQARWHARMRRQHADLRTAIEFGVSTPTSHDDALRILGRPWFLYAVALSLTEHRHWLDLALDAASAVSPARPAGLTASALVSSLQGDHAAASSRLDEARELTAGRDPILAAFTEHLEGMSTLFLGDLDRALRILDDIDARYGDLDAPAAMHAALSVHRGLLHIVRGELDAASVVLASAERQCSRSGELWVHSYVHAARGFVALADGELTDAAARADESLRLNDYLDDSIGRSLSLDLLAWTEAANGQSERAAVLLGSASALWHSFGQQLYGSADWQSRRARYERQARADLGGSVFDTAYSHGAGLSRREVVAFARNNVRPPRLPATTAVLSRRELEIARHLAQGLSNRDIADRLVVSPRTVEGHIGRTLAKLAFTSRTEIAVWVDRHDR